MGLGRTVALHRLTPASHRAPCDSRRALSPRRPTRPNPQVRTEAALGGKRYVMVLFAAGWCPACRAYTPLLAGAYTRAAAAIGAGLTVPEAEEVRLVGALLPTDSLLLKRRWVTGVYIGQ